MEPELKEILIVFEKKLESLEEKIKIIADEVNEVKEYIPATLDGCLQS